MAPSGAVRPAHRPSTRPRRRSGRRAGRRSPRTARCRGAPSTTTLRPSLTTRAEVNCAPRAARSRWVATYSATPMLRAGVRPGDRRVRLELGARRRPVVACRARATGARPRSSVPREQHDLAELAALGEAVVGLDRVARAGTSRRPARAARRRRTAAARGARSARAVSAFSSSGRARSVEARERGALAHQVAEVELAPSRRRRCR